MSASPTTSKLGSQESDTSQSAEVEPKEIDLKNPTLAMILAWLIPGLGHFYQGRMFKGTIFCVCILGLFATGVWLGGSTEHGFGRVVYVIWEKDQALPSIMKRPSYICQFATGIVAVPALIQAYASINNPETLPLGDYMKPPKLSVHGQNVELDILNRDLGRYWELGTVYTMIAGLLNVLAIYDASCGPVMLIEEDPARKKKKKSDKKDSSKEDPEAKEKS